MRRPEGPRYERRDRLSGMPPVGCRGPISKEASMYRSSYSIKTVCSSVLAISVVYGVAAISQNMTEVGTAAAPAIAGNAAIEHSMSRLARKLGEPDAVAPQRMA